MGKLGYIVMITIIDRRRFIEMRDRAKEIELDLMISVCGGGDIKRG